MTFFLFRLDARQEHSGMTEECNSGMPRHFPGVAAGLTPLGNSHDFAPVENKNYLTIFFNYVN